MLEMITSGLKWIIKNKEWIFSGIGVAILVSLIGLIKYFPSRRKQVKPILAQKISKGLSPVDVSLLNQMAQNFSGDDVHTFFELLSESG